jgi:hypothetical protein
MQSFWNVIQKNKNFGCAGFLLIYVVLLDNFAVFVNNRFKKGMFTVVDRWVWDCG